MSSTATPLPETTDTVADPSTADAAISQTPASNEAPRRRSGPIGRIAKYGAGVGLAYLAFELLGGLALGTTWLMSGGQPVQTDLAVKSVHFAAPAGARGYDWQAPAIVCVAPGQDRLMAYMKTGGSAPEVKTGPSSRITLTVRAADAAATAAEAEAGVMALDFGFDPLRNVYTDKRAMEIVIPAELRDQPLTWTATVTHPDDVDRANDTLTGTLPAC